MTGLSCGQSDGVGGRSDGVVLRVAGWDNRRTLIRLQYQIQHSLGDVVESERPIPSPICRTP